MPEDRTRKFISKIVLAGICLLISVPLGAWELASIITGIAVGHGMQYESELQSVKGLGAKIQAEWLIGREWYLTLSSDHLKYNLADDQAHLNWGWDYWLKIYGYTVYTLGQDPVYDVNLEPHQIIKVKPVTIGLRKTLFAKRRLHPVFGLEAGAVWYERKMWLEENWSKNFPAIDYTFEYDFRNYANARSGWVNTMTLSAELQADVSKSFGLSAGVEWRKYFQDWDNSGYFPMNSSLQAFLELQILYGRK